MADEARTCIELEIPDGVEVSAEAVELVRGWVADGQLRVSLNADAFGDRLGEWGRFLAQIGHHVAMAAALQGTATEAEALTAIRQGFESMHPVHEPTLSGKLRGRTSH